MNTKVYLSPLPLSDRFLDTSVSHRTDTLQANDDIMKNDGSTWIEVAGGT